MAPKPIAPAPDDSNNVNGIASALALFQSEHYAARKDKRNAHHGYDYTSLAATNQAIQPAAAVGICHSFTLHPVGTDGVICRLTVTHAPSQETIVSEFPILMGGKDPKVTGSLITYAKKYLLWGAYGLANDSDSEVDSDKGESERRGQTAPAKQNNRPNSVPPKQQQRDAITRTSSVSRQPEPAQETEPAQTTEPEPFEATENSPEFIASKANLLQKFKDLPDDKTAESILNAFGIHFKLANLYPKSGDVRTLDHCRFLHARLDEVLGVKNVVPF